MVRGDYGQESGDGGDHVVEPLRLCLLRFLRGNDFSVNKALSQVGLIRVSSASLWIPPITDETASRRSFLILLADD